MSAPATESAREREREVARMREAAKGLGVRTIGDGSWFFKLVKKHVEQHRLEASAEAAPALRADEAEAHADKLVASVARKSGAAGALASLGASTGELLSLFTEGLAAPIGLPAVAASIVGEAAYTARLQIDLVCDLASLYGVPFDVDDVGEVATLFGLALEVDLRPKKRAEEHDHERAGQEARRLGLTARLQDLEEGEIAHRLGKKMLEEAVMRNIVPFAGIAISARWNYVATQRLASAVRKYLRYRRALGLAFDRLSLDEAVDPVLLVEGCWLLATCDGDVSHEEMLAIALLMDKLPEERRRQVELDKTLGIEEEDWFEELRKAPPETHPAVLTTLGLIAATDRELCVGERRFLRRVGKTLCRDIDFDRIERTCEHFDAGEPLSELAPEGG